MTLRKQNFYNVQAMLEKTPETLRKHLNMANEENANQIARVAKVLAPVGKTARSKAAIKVEKHGESGRIVDFGPLSSILEGGTAERQTKTGKSTGKGPKRPFVNPALDATDEFRTARNRKAVRDALKEAKGSGNG
ncbi:hypothetical protein [Salipiger thiooxidans]|uniref:hypothetical protein n=1 Tax=Salipiger thiooxidans TaxID=282683 RepID=UPI001CF95D70|nr:hypothetical protein [Salipiger thiooxidans]